ncbi:hypothetical protein [Leptodesmis sp.]|uniref:hypothetical protein n=1 Tax=Leptodesmis sp. TaxID=3100501 RepID=UPI00405351CD
MKRLSCSLLPSSALRQPIPGQLAIAGWLMGEWTNHRPNLAGLILGAINHFFVTQFLVAQLPIVQDGRLIRAQIILPIQSGRCRESLC